MDTPKLSPAQKRRYAYVWLFMKGDFYLPGAFVSIYSVLRTNPDADLVAMVTNDVSEHAREMLKKVATHIFDVPYISFESKSLRTDRQKQLYGTWIAQSYTKWNVLALPYEKILLLDADTITTENVDELFNLDTPAMPMANPFIKPYGNAPNYYDGPVDLDGYPEHGTKLTLDYINNTLNKKGVLPQSSQALISPSIDDYHKYLQMVSDMQPFGFPECHNGFDEQSIAYFYTNIKKEQFTVMHHRYNIFPWKDGFTYNGEIPRIIHFFSDTKPWIVDYDKYPDITTWYKMANAAIEYANISAEDINIKSSNTTKANDADDSFIHKYLKNKDVLQIYGLAKIT
jgi:lipopolysaccharide biosynthesis glycosyltransferase